MIGSGCGVCGDRGGFGDNRGSKRLGKLADACQT